MPIRKLGPRTSQRLRSHVVIDSVDTVLRELIQNALDAGATSIRIKLDPASLSVCVEDNGRGIAPHDLRLVGKKNYSSSDGHPLRRGEALCSIGFCCAHVVLRTKTPGVPECCAGLAGQQCSPGLWDVLAGFFQLASLRAQGTQVMVSRIFSKLPVRRHTGRMLPNSAVLRLQLRSLLFEMLHGYEGVGAGAFLRTEGGFEKVLDVEACESPQSLFRRLFRYSGELQLVQKESSTCKLDGFFTVAGSQKPAHQFVFLNGRKIDRPPGLRRIFNAAGYKSGQRGVLGRSVRLHPLYCFDLTDRQDDALEAISLLEHTLSALLEVKKPSAKARLQLPLPQKDWGLYKPFKDEAFVALVCMRQMANLTAIGQILQQFLLASLEGQVFVLDQHACDERIRVEELFAEFSAAITDKSCNNRVRCLVPLAFPVSPDEADELARLRELFGTFGIGYDVTEKCTVTHLPRVLVHAAEPQLLKALLLQHVHDVAEGDKQPAMTGNWIQDVPNLPLAISDALVSRACHLSIRFGDVLIKSEMEYLIKQLAQCRLPFQCAHGRATIVPLEFSVDGFVDDETI